MTKFYYLHFNDLDRGSVAIAPHDRGIDAIEQIKTVIEIPFYFYLREGIPQDYQGNNLGWPLMSKHLKCVIDSSINKTMNLVWIKAYVVDTTGTKHDYFVPCFIEDVDVLNKQKSIIVKNNFVVKAHLSREKVGDMDFFPVPRSSTRIIISNRVKAAIESNALTGVDFGPVPIS